MKKSESLTWMPMQYALVDSRNRQVGVANWNFGSKAFELWFDETHVGYAKTELLALIALKEIAKNKRAPE